MKIGKVPEAVLKRSVLKQVNTKREEIVVGAGVGEDCAAVALHEDEVFVLSTDPITGTTKDMGELAVHITANDLASAGAEVVGMMLSILLPPDAEEADLKAMMGQISSACDKLNIQIMGGHTEVTAAVKQPVITITGVGKVKKGKLVTTGGAKPGHDVVVSKWIGLEGTAIIAKEKEEELKKKLPAELIETAKGFDAYISVVPDGKAAVSAGVSAMHDVTEGGIFGALWELAEASGVGLTIDLMQIPIRQETIEVCECFDINPYELISSGCMLMTAENGLDLVNSLKEQGIFASVIGKVTAGNDRVLMNGEEKRFLEPPKTDELYKIFE